MSLFISRSTKSLEEVQTNQKTYRGTQQKIVGFNVILTDDRRQFVT